MRRVPMRNGIDHGFGHSAIRHEPDRAGRSGSLASWRFVYTPVNGMSNRSVLQRTIALCLEHHQGKFSSHRQIEALCDEHHLALSA